MQMKKLTFLTLLFCSVQFLCAQVPEFLGSGYTDGISVTSSSEYSDQDIWPDTALGMNTLSGLGMNAKAYEAARFLQQASIGYSAEHIDDVLTLGMEGWIDDQFTKSAEYILPEVRVIEGIIADSILASNGNDSTALDRRPSWPVFNYAWWQTNMMNEDLLRHKVAAALSEILVISRKSDLSGFGDGMADYYDVLLRNAFGRYDSLLYDVTLHPCMGFYLTHANNPKTDTSQNIRPDENYAREFMQLFTIGLYELNQDGSRIVEYGNELATYSQADIREMSRVFTGLSYGDVIPNMYDTLPEFGMHIWNANVTLPMKMYDTDDPATMYEDEDQHENGAKDILGIETIPDGQTGLQDIQDAIRIIFDHPNVAPFVSYRLIQRLVKSNPSPAYITRVADVFDDNGSGIKGDMKAVIKAILLDEEARDCSYQMDPFNSRLKEPLFRYTHFARAVDKSNDNNFYWNVNYEFERSAKQDILASPSVFNFYNPDDTPNGPIGDAGLAAPRVQVA